MVGLIRIFSVSMALLIAMSVESFASESVSFDGIWWQALTAHEKIVAVQGFLAGYSAGSQDVLSEQRGAVDDPVYNWGLAHMPISTMHQMSKAYAKLAATATPAPHTKVGVDISFGAIVERIDSIYDTHPELAHAEVIWFIGCAATPDASCESAVAVAKKYGS